MDSEGIAPFLLLAGGLIFSALSKHLKKKRAAAAPQRPAAPAPLPQSPVRDRITPSRKKWVPTPIPVAEPKPIALKPRKSSRLRQIILSDAILNRPKW